MRASFVERPTHDAPRISALSSWPAALADSGKTSSVESTTDQSRFDLVPACIPGLVLHVCRSAGMPAGPIILARARFDRTAGYRLARCLLIRCLGASPSTRTRRQYRCFSRSPSQTRSVSGRLMGDGRSSQPRCSHFVAHDLSLLLSHHKTTSQPPSARVFDHDRTSLRNSLQRPADLRQRAVHRPAWTTRQDGPVKVNLRQAGTARDIMTDRAIGCRPNLTQQPKKEETQILQVETPEESSARQ